MIAIIPRSMFQVMLQVHFLSRQRAVEIFRKTLKAARPAKIENPRQLARPAKFFFCNLGQKNFNIRCLNDLIIIALQVAAYSGKESPRRSCKEVAEIISCSRICEQGVLIAYDFPIYL